MKHMSVIFTLLIAFVATFTSLAVEDVITLDDANPSIDAVISLPDGATGGVAIEMAGASLTLYDNAGNIVLQVDDARVHNVQFNLMPNTGDHTLHLERLEQFNTAIVRVDPISEFLLQPASQQVNSDVLGVDQSTEVVLNTTKPNATLDVSIPVDTVGLFSSNAPNVPTMSQFIDSTGAVVATTMGGHVDGLSMTLDGGDYQYVMHSTNVADETVADVRVTPYDIEQTPLLVAPASDGASTETVLVDNTAAASSSCTASVFVSSVNLRSGPGTGYSVLDYGFRDEVFEVGGTNPQNNWIVIAVDSDQTAWMTKQAANLSGDCADLSVFDVPYREAQPAEVIIVQPDPIIQEAPAVVSQSQSQQSFTNSSNNGAYYDDDDDHHEGRDDDEHEREGHDDDD